MHSKDNVVELRREPRVFVGVYAFVYPHRHVVILKCFVPHQVPESHGRRRDLALWVCHNANFCRYAGHKRYTDGSSTRHRLHNRRPATSQDPQSGHLGGPTRRPAETRTPATKTHRPDCHDRLQSYSNVDVLRKYVGNLRRSTLEVHGCSSCRLSLLRRQGRRRLYRSGGY